MDHPKGASSDRDDRVDFDPRVRLEFRGTQLSSDGGLLVMRELDDALGLSDLAATALRDTRRGKNTVHRLDGLFRQSVFGRLAGYEDVNDADRLALDPVMRQVVGGRAVDAQAASASQMGRFETETLALSENRAALADLNGQWIDRFHDRNGLKYIVSIDTNAESTPESVVTSMSLSFSKPPPIVTSVGLVKVSIRAEIVSVASVKLDDTVRSFPDAVMSITSESRPSSAA